MDFNSENKVIINSMNETEARAFILFLRSETARHQRDIEDVKELIHTVAQKFNLGAWDL